MRKLCTMIAAAAVFFALAIPAFADVLWTPQNSFYERHFDECTYVGRSYLANGEAGYVTLHSSPGGLTQIANVANRTKLFVGYTWEEAEGVYWAVAEYAEQDSSGKYTSRSGWIPLDDLALVYDAVCFEEDNGALFSAYDGCGDGLTSVCLYTYPGGVLCGTLREEKNYMSFSDAFQNLYTDDNGRRWTYIGYYLGRQNAWVCIDDPENESLGLDAPQAVFEVRLGTSEGMVEPSGGVPVVIPGWVLAALLAAAAALLTALMIRRRGKNTQNG